MLVNGSDFYCGNSSNNLCQLALRNQIPPQVDTSQFALKHEIENALSKKSIERTVSLSSYSDIFTIDIFTKDEMINVTENRLLLRLDLDGEVYPKYSDSYFYFCLCDTKGGSSYPITMIRGKEKGEMFKLSQNRIFIKYGSAFVPNGNSGGSGTPYIYGDYPIQVQLSTDNPPSSGSLHLKITSFSI